MHYGIQQNLIESVDLVQSKWVDLAESEWAHCEDHEKDKGSRLKDYKRGILLNICCSILIICKDLIVYIKIHSILFHKWLKMKD